MSAPLLELVALEKRFGATRAVAGVSLTLERGEIVALVGENGAGKTTLLSLLTGVYTADAGSIRVDGTALPPGQPRRAEGAGIGLVPQHSELVGPLTVAENAVLGREPRTLGLLFDRDRAEREVKDVAERSGLPLDPRARADSLSVAGKQRAEIVKLLWRGARIVALDEPTATLAPAETAALLDTLVALAKEGRGILLVSHKLAEVQRVATRIAVLRRGKIVAVLDGKAQLETVARAMAGEENSSDPAPATVSRTSTVPGSEPAQGESPRAFPSLQPTPPSEVRGPRNLAPALTLTAVSVLDDRGAKALAGLTLAIAPGEIVGVAGVDGNGQRELVELIVGLRPLASGTVRLGAHDVTRATIAARRALGLAYVCEDRLHGGLCADLSSEENLALGRLSQLSRFGLLQRTAITSRARTLLAQGDVRPDTPSLRAGGLSGGNQQKLLLARELDGTASLVVVSQPTRGLDPRATAQVHARLAAQAQTGAGTLLVSQDLDELRALAHRVVVLYRGAIADDLPVADATDARLSRAMLGLA